MNLIVADESVIADQALSTVARAVSLMSRNAVSNALATVLRTAVDIQHSHCIPILLWLPRKKLYQADGAHLVASLTTLLVAHYLHTLSLPIT